MTTIKQGQKMLTEIFATRYSEVVLWESFKNPERRLLVQGFRILSEQICPYWINGKASEVGKAFWADIQSLLSMELGLTSLSPSTYLYKSNWGGKAHTNTGIWTLDKVCENWMLKPFDGSEPADLFVKARLSLVEIGFRKRSEEIARANAKQPAQIAAAKLRPPQKSNRSLPDSLADMRKKANATINNEFQASVDELNTRFRQAGCKLNYHNGFIQLSTDELSMLHIETPFWALVSDPKWKNIDIDMKEAVDRRDTGGRDPAWYAARALESTIKIISEEKGWSSGKEKGAHNFIDNLTSKRATYIETWESELLKIFFTEVRNPLGHGPGKEEMPELSKQQTDWAIEMCMSWIKSLVQRKSP